MPQLLFRIRLVRVLFLFAFIVGVGILLRDHGGPMGVDGVSPAIIDPHPLPYRGKNRLAKAHSSYLRAAAHQPVWWHEWGPEPFLLARTLNRPILMDIGADWCHWCHVMDRETYANPEVARLVNAHFVAIKIDREERPDLDQRYQIAVRNIANKSGWPLTVFLTPQGEVFYGGTTFFAATVGNQLGLLDLLPQLADAYRREGTVIMQGAGFLRDQLRRYFAFDAPGERVDLELAAAVTEAIAGDFDREFGGCVSGQNKFPEPEVWWFLLTWNAYHPNPRWRPMVETTLHRMASGGVFDHLDGGFHRYATDRSWRVPHFEKLLSMNAMLLRLYLEAYAATKEGFYREVAEKIAHYLWGTLHDPATGLFRNHQDADSPTGEEGTYYTWSKAEIAAVLSAEERQMAMLAFGVADLPRHLSTQPERNVLTRDIDIAAVRRRLGWTADRAASVLAAAEATLRAQRRTRPAPPVADAAYTNANGMAIAALLRGAMLLDHAEWKTGALAALEWLWNRGWDEQTGIARGWIGGVRRPQGLLSDHVWFLTALLEAYDATADSRYVERAERVAALTERRFADPKGGGFFDRPQSAADATMWSLEGDPVKNFFDHGETADNPVAAMAYDRLAYTTDNPDWRATADGILLAIAGMHPGGVSRGLASYALATLYHVQPPAQVVVVGSPGDPVARALEIVARQHSRPYTIVRSVSIGTEGGQGLPEILAAQVAAAQGAGRPLAFLCVGTVCARPTADPTELDRQLASVGR